jgi:hypothetical protein
MRIPAGRYVAVLRSTPGLCPVCRDSRQVQALDVADPYGPLAQTRDCPHCSNPDPERPLPVIYLPTRQDTPRKDTSR